MIEDLKLFVGAPFHGQLEYSCVQITHTIDNGGDLRKISSAGGHGPVVGLQMCRATGGGKADGPGLYGVLYAGDHGGQVVLGGLFVKGPFAHDIGA